jgi:hypothetical protein
MKSFALFLLAAILPAAVHAQDSIRIGRVGLQGYYSTSVPTPVRVHIPTLAESQTIRVQFTVDSGDLRNPSGWWQTDRFEKQLQVTSGKPLDVDVPILFPANEVRGLRVKGTDAQGRVIGEDSIERGFKSLDGVSMIAIYCREDSQCLEAQSQISPIRKSQEGWPPRNDLRFVLLKELAGDWLDYAAAYAVVIAGSIADITSEQATALEYFLRSGGILVLLEKEVANNRFLASYRQGPAPFQPLRVGKGRFYRVSSLQSKELTEFFAVNPPTGGAGTPRVSSLGWNSAVDQVLGRIGVSFTFPRLRWLLIWVGLYILIVGPANFTLLKRLRKLEWGWVTVGVTALFFAAGLYLASSAQRPKHFTLDGAIIYWMDGYSPVAYEELGFRISSPCRKQVGLTIDEDVLLARPLNFQWDQASEEYLGAGITGHSGPREGWMVQLAPPLRIETPMRRWSFRDFYAQGFHEFSGSVHWTSATRLKNDTGRRFREAIYLDFAAHKRYAIAGMAPGEEVDLASINPMDYLRLHKDPSFTPMLGQIRAPAKEPLFSEKTIFAGLDLFPAKHIFAGVVEPAGINASLDAEGTTPHNVAVAIIGMDQP